MANISQFTHTGQGNNPPSPFEAIRHIDEQGNEFWFARELMPLLGYERWENFEKVIARARLSLQNQGQDAEKHLRGVTKPYLDSVGREQVIKDVKCSRLACYVITQNGDPRKEEIANGQGYFAIKTYERETLPENTFQMIAMLATQMDSELKQVKQSQLKTKNDVKLLEYKQNKLEDSLHVDGPERGQLKELVEEIVNTSPTLHWRNVWGTFNKRFGLASYHSLPKKRFVEGKEFLALWLENEKQTNTLPDQKGLFDD